ncbi:MAG: MFS transporter [Opitutales bacterium]|nr:MFS transporter [Opitutales bacterium]
MVLLTEELGASPFVVGLCYSFVFLLAPFQILATALLHILGYKRQTIFFWSLRGLCIIPILWIAFSQPERGDPVAIWTLVIALFFFTIFRSIGAAAPIPWLYDLIPERVRGRYFATDLAIVGFCGVFTLILCAAAFLYLDTFTAIQSQFLFAIAGSFIAVFAISRLPSVPHPEPNSIGHILKAAPRLFTENRAFRNYTTLSVIVTAVNAAAYPFFAFYLKRNAGFDQVPILYFAAIQSFGGYLGALVVRSWIDRVSVRYAFIVSLVLHIINYTYWISVLVGFEGLLFLCPFMFFLIGGAGSFYHAAHNKHMPQLTDRGSRPLSVALITTSIGFGTGIFASGLGFVLKDKDGAFSDGRFLIYLGFALLVQVVLIIAYKKMEDQNRDAEPLVAITGWLRPFRGLFSFGLPLQRSGAEEKDHNHAKD